MFLLLKDRVDLEDATYVGRIKPNESSGEERRAANIRSVVVSNALLSSFEEPFCADHECDIPATVREGVLRFVRSNFG